MSHAINSDEGGSKIAKPIVLSGEGTQLDMLAAAEWVPLDKLIPWPDNPRDNDESVYVIMVSIETFGFATPIVARAANMEISAGHTRWKAMKKLTGMSAKERLALVPEVHREAPGWTQRERVLDSRGVECVPVRKMDISEAASHRLAMADNKTNELAEWDDEGVARLLDELGPVPGFEDFKQDPDVPIEVEEVQPKEPEFFLSVRGPIPKMPDAIELLRKHLCDLEGVHVDGGYVGDSGR